MVLHVSQGAPEFVVVFYIGASMYAMLGFRPFKGAEHFVIPVN